MKFTLLIFTIITSAINLSGASILLTDTNIFSKSINVIFNNYDSSISYNSSMQAWQTFGTGKNYMYFDLIDDFNFRSGNTIAHIRIRYFDNAGYVALDYDATDTAYKRIVLQRNGTNTWVERDLFIDDANFNGRQNSNCDFRIYGGDSINDQTLYIAFVEINFPRNLSVLDGIKPVYVDYDGAYNKGAQCGNITFHTSPNGANQLSNYIYFDIDDSYHFSESKNVKMRLTYYDNGSLSSIDYDSLNGTESISFTQSIPTYNCKTVMFSFNAYFANRINGADFRIKRLNNNPLHIVNVEIISENSSVILGPSNLSNNLNQIQVSHDGITSSGTINGITYRATRGVNTHRYIYFNVEDYFAKINKTKLYAITVNYLDQGNGWFSIQYDSISNAYKSLQPIYRTNTNTWKSIIFLINDANFANRQNGNCDFRIYENSEQLYVSKVVITPINNVEFFYKPETHNTDAGKVLFRSSSVNNSSKLNFINASYDGQIVSTIHSDAKRTNIASGHRFIYFGINDSYDSSSDSINIGHIAIKYLDNCNGEFRIQYDSLDGSYKPTAPIIKTGTNLWKWAIIDINRTRFNNSQNGGADFRIEALGSNNLTISEVIFWNRKEFAGKLEIKDGHFYTNNKRLKILGVNYILPWTVREQWCNSFEDCVFGDAWKSGYNSLKVEADFQLMEEIGINAIRAWIPFQDYVYSTPLHNSYDPLFISNVNDFYQRAHNHGIKIFAQVGEVPNWIKHNSPSGRWPSTIDKMLDVGYQNHTAQFIIDLISNANLLNYDSFCGFDLQNELSFAALYDPNRYLSKSHAAYDFYWNLSAIQLASLSDPTLTPYNPHWEYTNVSIIKLWNDWVKSKYGSLASAYIDWGYQATADSFHYPINSALNTGDTKVVYNSDNSNMCYPPTSYQFVNSGIWKKKVHAYYKFLHDSLNSGVNNIKSKIKNSVTGEVFLTTDLVIRSETDNNINDSDTIKMLTTNYYEASRASDFIFFNIYDSHQTNSRMYIERMKYLSSLKRNKPLLLAEFGVYGYNYGSQVRQSDFVKEYINLCTKADIDGLLVWDWKDETPASVYDQFSIINSDGSEKLAASIMRFNKLFTILDFPEPSRAHFIVNWDEYHSPLELFYGFSSNKLEQSINEGLIPQISDKCDFIDIPQPVQSVLPVDKDFVILAKDDFSNGSSFWSNIPNGTDDADWTFKSGRTPSNFTGPDGDASSSGDGQYLYVEASHAPYIYTGKSAVLESSVISTQFPINELYLSFSTHSHGDDIGSLEIQIKNNFGQILNTHRIFNEQTHFYEEQKYNRNCVDLTSYISSFPIKISIIATSKGGYRGDIALDNIMIIGFY